MRGMSFFCVFTVFLFIPSVVFCAPAEVPQSGQTTSYTSGDDGDIQSGVPLPSPRFTDNGDGTVKDNLTGLIWLKDANCFGAQTWQDALIKVNTLNSGECALSDGSIEGDWHLPNDNELWSLINAAYYNPAISNTAGTGQWSEGDPFTGVQSGVYWSSTTNAKYTDFAWLVFVDYGLVYATDKEYSHYVWPVRGAQGGSFYDLVISRIGSGSGTVTSSPAGIDCGSDCTETYEEETIVTLTASPDAGSIFSGWSGDADCADGIVTMTAARNCTAAFDEEEPLSLPGKAELIYPAGYIPRGTDQEFQWNAVPEADDYYLFVRQNSSGFLYQQWYSAGEAGCASGTGMCSVTPDMDLNNGLYFWYVQTRNEAGTGPRSFKLFFAGY